MNDYIDRESDKKNHPERPIPSGKLKAQTALISAFVLFGMALGISWFINTTCFALVLLALLAELCYEFIFKKITGLGNLVIGFQTGLAYIFGGYIIGESYAADFIDVQDSSSLETY